MDSTTKMLVDQIIKQGWYRKSQTLGEGGWLAIRRHFGNLNQYNLYGGEVDEIDLVETIYAKDDDTAISAFRSLYNLDEFGIWDIHEVVTEYRLIDTNDKGE